MKIPAIIGRIYSESSEDRILAVAGGITFFFLLALFPAISSLVAVYGLLADRSAIVEGLALASGFLPEGATIVLRSELHRLVSQRAQALDLFFFSNLAIALWSASGGMKALLDGLNIAFETTETRSFVRISITGILFTLGALGLACAGTFCAVQVSRYFAHHALGAAWRLLFEVLVWPSAFIGCSLVLSLIYRFGPNREQTPWRWITWGSAFAATFWILGTMLFTWYVAHFGSYNRTYGDLGAAVGFLTWVWLSIVVLLLGAEIIYEMDHARAQGGRRGKRA